MKPSIGRIVHFVNKFGNGSGPNNHVAAIIVRVWSDTCVNLRIFYDGTNDVPLGEVDWETSISYDETGINPRTWHWPEKV